MFRRMKKAVLIVFLLGICLVAVSGAVMAQDMEQVQADEQVQAPGETQEQAQSAQEKPEKVYIGTKISRTYHYPWCPWAERAKPGDTVTFISAKEAWASGYQSCNLCNPPIKD